MSADLYLPHDGVDTRRGMLYRLRPRQRLTPTRHAHPAERLELVVRQHVDALPHRKKCQPSHPTPCLFSSYPLLVPFKPVIAQSKYGPNMKTHPMIRLQIINLLPEHHPPDILAQELDDVEVVAEPRPIPREPLRQPLPHAEPQPVEPEEHLVFQQVFVEVVFLASRSGRVRSRGGGVRGGFRGMCGE